MALPLTKLSRELGDGDVNARVDRCDARNALTQWQVLRTAGREAAVCECGTMEPE